MKTFPLSKLCGWNAPFTPALLPVMWITMIPAGAGDLYWRTDGAAGGTWTSSSWSDPASPTGGTGWTPGNNAIFTENSTLTFATATVGNVAVAAGKSVTITADQKLTLGGVRNIDVGTGAVLNWASQSQSTDLLNVGAGIIKTGEGTLNWGAGPGNNSKFSGGFTVKAGKIIVSGQYAFGSGPVSLEGGIIQTSGGNSFSASSLTIGGNFEFAGTGNDIWNQSADLGGGTRTITQSASGDRKFTGKISNGGLIKAGTGTLTLTGANDYTGGTTVSAGTLSGTTNGLQGAVTNNATLTFDQATTGTFAGSIDGTGNLIKTGAGTVTLTNSSSHAGTTTISGGTLVVSGGLSGSGTVTVSTNGKLAGTGNITGAATIQIGGKYSAGALDAVGSQSFSSSLAFNSGSIFDWDLNENSISSGFDTVSAVGNIAGGTTNTIFRVVLGSSVDFGQPFWTNPSGGTQSWTLASIFGKSLSSGGFQTIQTSRDVSSFGSFAINSSALTWTPVPEPSSPLVGFLITAGLLRRTRERRVFTGGSRGSGGVRSSRRMR